MLYSLLYFQMKIATLEETDTLSSTTGLCPSQGPDIVFSFDKSHEAPLSLLL